MVQNNYTLQEKNVNSAQLAWNQINFLLTRFNFTSEQFREEINYLLANSTNSQFNFTQFTAKLLAKCHQLLIIANWNREPHYLTNDYQVLGAQRLLGILDLNEWLELTSKSLDPTYDPDFYSYTRQSATSQLQKLAAQFRNPLQFLRLSAREPANSPPTPTTGFCDFSGDFYSLSY